MNSPFPSTDDMTAASLALSQAASAGVPVHVLGMDGLSPKLQRFHEELARAGASREWDGRLLTWQVQPLAQAEAAAAALAARLG